MATNCWQENDLKLKVGEKIKLHNNVQRNVIAAV